MTPTTPATPHVAKPPFAASSGPKDAKIAFVAEAWGEHEERQGVPLVGASGQEFTRMLRDAGLQRAECFLTNVLAFRPPNNNLEALCVPKAQVPKTYTHGPISLGKYLREEYLVELERLYAELGQVRPNIVVLLGNTACWAVLGSGRISSIRGTVTQGKSGPPGLKYIPTYHPAAVLRQWSLRPIVLSDLLKAKRESAFPEVRRPERYVTVNPTIETLQAWRPVLERAAIISCDIETSRGQITHVGFAPERSRALCVPFVTPNGASYWPTASAERCAWEFVRDVLALDVPKLFQNGLYDCSWFARQGLRVRNVQHDTMLRHHAMYAELQKGLGFLGSIYTNESSWKLLRGRNVSAEKRDDE